MGWFLGSCLLIRIPITGLYLRNYDCWLYHPKNEFLMSWFGVLILVYEFICSFCFLFSDACQLTTIVFDRVLWYPKRTTHSNCPHRCPHHHYPYYSPNDCHTHHYHYYLHFGKDCWLALVFIQAYWSHTRFQAAYYMTMHQCFIC